MEATKPEHAAGEGARAVGDRLFLALALLALGAGGGSSGGSVGASAAAAEAEAAAASAPGVGASAGAASAATGSSDGRPDREPIRAALRKALELYPGEVVFRTVDRRLTATDMLAALEQDEPVAREFLEKLADAAIQVVGLRTARAAAALQKARTIGMSKPKTPNGDIEERGAAFASEVYQEGERDGAWAERARVVKALREWADNAGSELGAIALRVAAERIEEEEHLP